MMRRKHTVRRGRSKYGAGGWFMVDLRDMVLQRVTHNAESNPPRFIKVFATDTKDAFDVAKERRAFYLSAAGARQRSKR
jgi:hypothetical protein